MKTKTAQETAAKWSRVTPDRAQDYEEGVRNPDTDWAEATLAAEPNYEEGIRKSITNKSFSKGVKKTGTAGQQNATIEKGLTRWPEGVRLAENKMATAMDPVIKVLQATTLPPRYPKGDPRNLKRVEAVTVALHNMKIGS